MLWMCKSFKRYKHIQLDSEWGASVNWVNWNGGAIFSFDMTNLPDKFANYFVDKIVTIQDTIATQQTSISNLEQLRSGIVFFYKYQPHSF